MCLHQQSVSLHILLHPSVLPLQQYPLHQRLWQPVPVLDLSFLRGVRRLYNSLPDLPQFNLLHWLHFALLSVRGLEYMQF